MRDLAPLTRPSLIPSGVLLIPARDAARMLSVSERTLWDWTAPRGTLACVRRPGSGRVLYSVETLRAWIAEQEANPIPPARRPRSNGNDLADSSVPTMSAAPATSI